MLSKSDEPGRDEGTSNRQMNFRPEPKQRYGRGRKKPQKPQIKDRRGRDGKALTQI